MIDSLKKNKIDALSISSQLSSHFFKLFFLIFVGGWAARYLGTENYGNYQYSITLFALFRPIGQFGMQGGLSILMCENKNQEKLLSTALTIQVIGSFILSFLIVLIFLPKFNTIIFGLILMAAIGNIFNSFEIFESYLLHLQKGVKVAQSNFIQTLSYGFLFSLALIFELPVIFFGFFQALQVGIKGLSLYIFSTKLTKQTNKYLKIISFEFYNLKRLISKGLPCIVSAMSILLYTKSDILMINWFMGPESTGIYSIATLVISTQIPLPSIFSRTVYPALGSEAFNSSTLKLHKYKRYLRLYWIAGLLFSAVGITFSAKIIEIIFGINFADSAPIARSLSISIFSIWMGFATTNILLAYNKEKLDAYRVFVAGILNIVLNYFLIPKFGLQGAAFSSILSYFFGTFLLLAIKEPKLALYSIFPFF